MSQIQEAYTTLAEIDRLLANIELKITNITSSGKRAELTETVNLYKEIVKAARTWLLLVDRMGLPEDAKELITQGQRIIVIFNQMYRAGMLLFSGSPWGVATGIALLAMSELFIMEGY